jgi:hypothetical protein
MLRIIVTRYNAQAENAITTLLPVFYHAKVLKLFEKKFDDNFFRMKITLTLQKDYLPVHVVIKAISETLNAYTRAHKYLEM